MSATAGIVVVNFASHELLAANVPAASPDMTVVVVDNWHTAEERRAVVELSESRQWRFVGLDDNRGFGAAANAGMRDAVGAGCATLVVLNPDARASETVLRELHADVARHPAELVAPVVEDSTGRRVFVGVELLWRNGRMRRAAPPSKARSGQLWLTGACLAMHRDAVTSLGGFSEDYFLYWEDVDLSVRAARAGLDVRVRDDLVVVHDEGGTQGRAADDRNKSDRYYFYNARNRLLFAARLLSRRRRLAWLLVTPAASWEILMRGGRRQLLTSRAPLWATIAGTRDGVRAVLRSLFGRASKDGRREA